MKELYFQIYKFYKKKRGMEFYMKKIFLKSALIIILLCSLFFLTGCTMQIETTDNSVSASVDGDTTEKVDGILDWIGNRLRRVFKTESSETTSHDA